MCGVTNSNGPTMHILTIFYYCCPIKVDRRKKIRLGYRFDGRVCFFDFKAPPHSKSEGSGGASDALPRMISQSFSG